MTVYTRSWQDRRLVQGKKFIVSRRPEDVGDDSVEEIIEKLKSEGELFEPNRGMVKKV